MKIIKIKKSFHNGSKERYLVLLNEPYSDDDIEYLVQDWCDSDPNGSVLGFRFDWWYVDDKETINKVLEENIILINNQIADLNTKKAEMEKYLK